MTTLPNLADPARAGVHPLPFARLAELRAHARALQYRLAEINCEHCIDKAPLLAHLARRLHLPTYFGHNWDALYDCLTDPLALPPAPGHILLLTHTAALQNHAPQTLATLLEICTDAAHAAAQETPPRPLWTFLLS